MISRDVVCFFLFQGILVNQTIYNLLHLSQFREKHLTLHMLQYHAKDPRIFNRNFSLFSNCQHKIFLHLSSFVLHIFTRYSRIFIHLYFFQSWAALKLNVISIPGVWSDRTDRRRVCAVRSAPLSSNQFAVATAKRISTNASCVLMPANSVRASSCCRKERVVSQVVSLSFCLNFSLFCFACTTMRSFECYSFHDCVNKLVSLFWVG